MPATYLIHKQSHASYPGGFKKVNGRMNNSPAYNHAYYEDNKEKWPKYPSQMPTAVKNRLARVNAKKESGTSSTKRLMGNGAPSSANPSGFKGTTDNKPYTPSAKWQARMSAAGKRYEAAKAEEARKAAAEAEAKTAKASSGSSKKSGSGKSKKSDAEKQAEKEAKEQEKAEKKAAKEAEAAKKKKEKEEAAAAKKKAKESAASETKTETAKEEKKDPIDEDETLSEREKKMYKGIQNVLEKSGQSMATYYANKGFDSIFAQYFPGDIDPEEKAAIKKKFMKYYKLEHGDASIGNYYGVIFSKAEIKHHGILGQKWGKRNGPPYPLDAEDHSQREKKAGWRKSLDKDGPSETQKKSGLQLTDKQKKMLKIGAAVAVTGLAAYGLYRLGGTGAISSATDAVSDFVNNSDLANTIVHHLNEQPNFVQGITPESELRKLTDSEIRAFKGYSVPGFYKEVNGIADTLLNREYDPQWLNGVNPIAKDISENIESAMQKMTINRDVDVQRGINENTCRRILGDSMFNELVSLRNEARKSGENIVGANIDSVKRKIINPKGFTSTAVPLTIQRKNSEGIAEVVRRSSVANV